jgi:hypothetical protein
MATHLVVTFGEACQRFNAVGILSKGLTKALDGEANAADGQEPPRLGDCR